METLSLTTGERIALAAGKEITTPPQMAACYIVAYDKTRNRTTNFGHNDIGSRISDDIAMEIGLNPETYRRTVNKFIILLEDKQDDPEFTNSEHIYEKIILSYNKYVDLKYEDVFIIAKTAFTEDSKELGEKLKDAHADKLKKYAQRQKDFDKKTGADLMLLYASLNGKVKNAKDQAINSIAKKYDKDRSVILRIWNVMNK